MWRYRITPRRLGRTSKRGLVFLAVAILVTVVAVLTSGCQSAPIRVVTSAESVMACHVADGLTTAIAISKGAVEANPLMAPLVGALGPWGFLAFKVAIGYWAYTKLKDTDTDPTVQGIIGAHNLLICGAAVHNVGVIKGMR